LRPLLPGRGFVNVAEARAIVRLLENLIDDLPADPAERPASIAVLPLYSAQAELIRHLVGQSSTLASCRLPLWVEAAGRCRQREADVVVVGLTRSHSHRAVSYGEDPDSAVVALTRARRRLVLVGDPGTLARRAQWEGQLDRLDEAAAARERAWVGTLVRLLQGQGAAIVHLREGPP
jgi:superfamily I DNA and/or RNA helicase